MKILVVGKSEMQRLMHVEYDYRLIGKNVAHSLGQINPENLHIDYSDEKVDVNYSLSDDFKYIKDKNYDAIALIDYSRYGIARLDTAMKENKIQSKLFVAQFKKGTCNTIIDKLIQVKEIQYLPIRGVFIIGENDEHIMAT